MGETPSSHGNRYEGRWPWQEVRPYAPVSENPYIRLLVKLYRFMSRRVECQFNKVVMGRLFMSKMNRPPISLSKLVKLMGDKDQVAVMVGTVTDDVRMLDTPKGL